MADDRFYVKTLRMQNFRCFEDVELGPFDPHFNLLVGENGAGKSSVLLALADLIRTIGDRGQKTGPRRIIEANDIRFEHFTSENGVITQKVHTDIKLEAVIVEDGNETRENLQGHDIFAGNVSSFDIPESVFPIALFYRTARAFREGAPATKGNLRLRRRRVQAHLDWDNAGVSNEQFREWFKLETLSVLQSAARQKEDVSSKTINDLKLLPMVAYAVVSAVRGTRKIEYDADLEDIVIENNTGNRHEFFHMSDGQRSFIGLVADIARRACLMNASFLGAQTLLKTPGLVLIDEIDLHLHPKWQRQIVPALKEIFPKIQFFATTHSPQVIGECKPEEIVLLTPQGQKRPSGGYGRDSNWILECVMDAEGRDPNIAARLKELFELIEDDKFDEAREIIKTLRRDIGYGPEIVEAEAYLWRMEHLGEEAAE